MVDDCTHFYGNSRRAGFHDPCGFVTDIQYTSIEQRRRVYAGHESLFMTWDILFD